MFQNALEWKGYHQYQINCFSHSSDSSKQIVKARPCNTIVWLILVQCDLVVTNTTKSPSKKLLGKKFKRENPMSICQVIHSSEFAFRQASTKVVQSLTTVPFSGKMNFGYCPVYRICLGNRRSRMLFPFQAITAAWWLISIWNAQSAFTWSKATYPPFWSWPFPGSLFGWTLKRCQAESALGSSLYWPYLHRPDKVKMKESNFLPSFTQFFHGFPLVFIDCEQKIVLCRLLLRRQRGSFFF